MEMVYNEERGTWNLFDGAECWIIGIRLSGRNTILLSPAMIITGMIIMTTHGLITM